MSSGLTAGFLLDRQRRWLRGMDATKKPALLTIGRLLAESRAPYAIIGGVAVQIHHPEPRTTLNIEVAVSNRDPIPREALAAAGFRHTGSFEHSENWVSADEHRFSSRATRRSARRFAAQARSSSMTSLSA